MKKKTSAIIASLATIAMCTNLVVGATYALFTSESEVNIAVSSGKVDVKASLANLQYQTLNVTQWTAATDNKTTFDGIGGSAEINGATLTLDKIVPGDAVKFDVNITNESTVNVKYRVLVNNDEEKDLGLFDGLDVKVNEVPFEGEVIGQWTELAPTVVDVETVEVEIALPNTGDPAIDNQYNGQNNSCEIVVTVEAVQGNADVKNPADEWDGTADTSWYNENETEFALTSAEQLAGFAELVDAGNTFAGKTVKLDGNLDLYKLGENGEPVSFDPIGYGYNVPFKGTFDGQGHTISNLYQNGWALGLDYSTEGGGLFASVVDATFKDLTIENAEIVMECIDMGTLVGYSYGNTTYENITISNSTIANYNRYTGGLVGEVNGTQTFKNITIDKDTVVSALWGTYDAGVGGIVGGKWGDAQLTFEDCVVECQLDVFNDVCANYQYYLYRLSGMLIGMSEEVTDGVATASYLKATNCKVIYGDWINYTYCEFESNGVPSYADPGEWKFSRVQEGYATGGVDPNHTHDTDEDHDVLIVFDQLFGGDKGVRGGRTHEGVEVVYPASYIPEA